MGSLEMLMTILLTIITFPIWGFYIFIVPLYILSEFLDFIFNLFGNNNND